MFVHRRILMAETMSPEREGEIIRALFKHSLTKKELILKPGLLRRELGNAAKLLNIPAKELRAVCGKLLKELVDDTLAEQE